ncbi:sporulation protein YqfD [Bariatricus massiliensis]|uniref:Sporulation protein YqfD n=1 Tax=Bariatricus massiliensis TaxID=1745713 RepID=A0ABS8DCC3_9FIRM|nr:sporulation protein YqfD [Bariatricus massiliensis]MCB7303259.1 sporulation protein YqfD [Bariatricus massiliensis]MCB7373391.1 sporulation protein YqfD [Bariatricus massiliensis]MCB7386061.1 sporulation protein YqfD [Bariatricus massiliensis]MCB7410223.1 sporulation protein YqfD [Bariatricus massiliensis]MCQ5252493.1 sporulation protein YqfD [Bariatricus massiliensis]
MLIAILQYLSGYLIIRIEGYSPERFLNMCSHHGIYLWNLKPCGHAYEMNISVKGFRRLKPIIRKTGTKIIIRERRGFPFFLHKYRKRKIFFGGIFFCIISIYILSMFVWNIHIEGNQRRTDEVILEFLEKKGVTHGMFRSSVDCSRIVKDIRKEYNDIIWVSAYMEGTRLMIQVKENQDTIETKEKLNPPVDIVADKDGIVKSIITRKGVPMVHEGDEVKKGDVLVSGTVEVLNDAKEVIDYQYHESDADIQVQTVMEYEDSMPITYEEKKMTGRKRYAVWFRAGGRNFTLGVLNNSFSHAVTETWDEQWKLGEHFWMPFSGGLIRVQEYEPQKKKRGEKEYQQLLTADFQKFCHNLEKKGVQILENDVKIYKETDTAAAKGNLTLLAPAGEKQAGQEKEVPQADTGESGQQEGN